MRLLKVGIKNFKSLRDVTFKPGDLTVLIGPNGAGKSNLVQALDFIGEMYRSGLDTTMTSYGGYGTVAYHSTGDSDVDVSFEITVALSRHDRRPVANDGASEDCPRDLVVRHRVTVGPGRPCSGDPYRIIEEVISFDGKLKHKRTSESLLRFERGADGVRLCLSPYVRQRSLVGPDLNDEDVQRVVSAALDAQPGALAPTIIDTLLWPEIGTQASLGAIKLTHVTLEALRQPGVPTPEPRLGREGTNLPAVLRWLEVHDLSTYQAIVNELMTVDRSLDDLEIVETAQQTLELRFLEAGSGRRWSAHEASGGTLRSLGLFTALLDPRVSIVVIEEPENSLHAWAIQGFVDACRELAEKQKQIILTTHSPIVVDRVRPDDVWIVSKSKFDTHVDRLADLDPDAKPAWEEGEIDLAYYLRSSIVPEATPATPLSILVDPL